MDSLNSKDTKMALDAHSIRGAVSK